MFRWGPLITILCGAVLGCSASTAAAPGSHSRQHGRCPGAELQPTARNFGEVEAATLCLVNLQRAAHAEPPLAPNHRLCERPPRPTAPTLVSHDYFNHTSPRGQTFVMRVVAAGYIVPHAAYSAGENIVEGSGRSRRRRRWSTHGCTRRGTARTS